MNYLSLDEVKTLGEIEPNSLILGDCLEVMLYIRDQSVDMVLCDLPYEVTARNSWDVIIPFEPLWAQYERIIKVNGAMVFTCTFPFTAKLYNSKPELFRYDLVWEKTGPTGYLNANKMPMRNHENILVFYKKPPTYNKQYWYSKPYRGSGGSNSLNYGVVKEKREIINEDGRREPLSVIQVSNEKKGLHPTKKPLALMQYLIKMYTNPEDLVLDNACGSGSTCVAAKICGRNFIGIEMDGVYYNTAQRRIENTPVQLELGI